MFRKNNMKLLKVLLLLCFNSIYCQHEIYKGYKTYNIRVTSVEQSAELTQVVSATQADFLSKPRLNGYGVVLVSPYQQTTFVKRLEMSKIEYSVHRSDVQMSLQRDDILLKRRRREATLTDNDKIITFNAYYRYKEINEYMSYLAKKYPSKTTLVHAGKSFEGREIKYLKIFNKKLCGKAKNIIYIDSAIHAREWITVPVALYVMHKLLEDSNESNLTKDIEWIVHPIVNPDGYEYSWTNDRLWRKSRSTDGSKERKECPGVDLNRNFGFSWNDTENDGASTDPCSMFYQGPKAFSEPETQVVKRIVEDNCNAVMYFNFHSWGSQIQYAWNNILTPTQNRGDLQAVGEIVAKAIDSKADSKTFPKYVVGNGIDISQYYASGTTDDYAHSVGIPLTLIIELPGLLANSSSPDAEGFLLDPKYIPQIVKETWEGIKAGVSTAINGTDWRSRSANDTIVQCHKF